MRRLHIRPTRDSLPLLRLAVCLLCLPGLLGLPAWSQSAEPGQPEPSEQSLFFDTVDVNVVNVEVFVSGQDGQPVPGLTREDFELLEDGKSVEITNFLAIEDKQITALGEANPVEEDSGTYALPQDQRLHVVIFLDNLNLEPRDRNQVLAHLRRFLRESLDNQDRVMLMTFDGTVDVVQEFTSIPELIQPLIEQESISSGRAYEVALQRNELLRQIEAASIDPGALSSGETEITARDILSGIRIYAQQIFDRSRATLKALDQVVASLAGLPGRKAVLYVSGGLPLKPGDALFEAFSRKFGGNLTQINIGAVDTEFLNFDASAEYRKLVDYANGNRVVMYTIDAVRNRSMGSVGAEISGFDLGGLNSPSGGRIWTSDLDSRLTSNYRESLRMMAEETGGLAFINTKGLGKTLGRLASDFDSYYSLGYAPHHQGDGKYHRLEVKVRGKNVHLRHRAGYQDKTATERMSDRTLSALLLNVADNPLKIEVERADGVRDAQGYYDVPILVKVPLGKLALLPDKDVYQGKISVFVAVRDSRNHTSPVQEVPLPIRIPNERVNQALDQYAGYTFQIKMREGFQRLAVGVRDEVSTLSSTIRLSFRVGEQGSVTVSGTGR